MATNQFDLNRVLSDFIKWINSSKKRPGKNPFLGFLGMVLLAFVIWLSSGIYKLLPYEQALVLRFGKWVRTEDPGLHYHLPSPIETIQKVPTGTIHRMDIGVPSGYQGYPAADEAIVLTGDENILHIGMSLSWQIKDLSQFVLVSQDPMDTLEVAAESVLRENIGQTNTAPIISRSGWADLNNKILQELQTLVDQYQIGIRIVNVELHTALAPQPVADSFAEVQRAKTFQEQLINDAHAYSNDKIPKARGEKTKIVQEAAAKAAQTINLAQGRAKRFDAIYEEYKKAPDLNKQRIFIETITKVLSENKQKQFFDKAFIKTGVVPYMNIQNLDQQTKKEAK
jgi:membrane protease subunit HflK